MKNPADRYRTAGLLLLAAFMLRAAIPVGYMPAAPGSGLLFELCPDGMPAWFAQSGEHAHHHHGEPDSAGEASADQCQMGHMLSSASAVGDFSQLDVVNARPDFSPAPARPERGMATATYRSRDPPA